MIEKRLNLKLSSNSKPWFRCYINQSENPCNFLNNEGSFSYDLLVAVI